MKNYVARWGDHVYEEGKQIKDEREVVKCAIAKHEDIEAFKRQTKLQKLSSTVHIINPFSEIAFEFR
jgi:hypothetical protein